jgi:hypothetical protein
MEWIVDYKILISVIYIYVLAPLQSGGSSDGRVLGDFRMFLITSVMNMCLIILLMSIL